MANVLIEHLSSILSGIAAVIFATGFLISVLSNRRVVLATRAEIEKAQVKIDNMGVKVDGGLTAMMQALADIAKTAQIASSIGERKVRSTDIP